MPMAAIGPALTGVSAIAGLFGGKKQETSTKPTYSPDQSAVQHGVGDLLQTRLANPTGYVDTIKNTAKGDVNSNFAGIEERMKRKLVGKGFGKSGKLNQNEQQLDIARMGEMTGLDAKFAGLQMEQDNRLVDESTRFGFAGGGTQTTGTSGGGVGAAIGGGAETATMLYALNHFMGGGGMDIPMDTQIGR
jgi:hypothetical protein